MKKTLNLNKKEKYIFILSVIGILISILWVISLPINIFTFVKARKELKDKKIVENVKIKNLNFILSIIALVLSITFLSLEFLISMLNMMVA